MTQTIKNQLIQNSRISFGAASISGEGGGYGFGPISEKDATQLIHYAVDKGLNVFDSAPIYGFGLSEKRLGKALKSMREKVILTSKSGVSWHENGRVNMSNDPQLTEKMLLQSLKDLQTDYIDLYFIHWPDEKVDIRRPMEVLARYQDKGVIKALGLCNTNLQDLHKAQQIANIEVIQSEYNLFNPQVEVEILPYCQEKQITFMGWGTLDKGVLTGQYQLNKERDVSDCRRSAPWWKKSTVEKKLQLFQQIFPLIPEGYGPLDLAISFSLKNYPQSTALCGARSPQQLDQLLAALKNVEQFQQKMDWPALEKLLLKSNL